jgi:hypothetical protein
VPDSLGDQVHEQDPPLLGGWAYLWGLSQPPLWDTVGTGIGLPLFVLESAVHERLAAQTRKPPRRRATGCYVPLANVGTHWENLSPGLPDFPYLVHAAMRDGL